MPDHKHDAGDNRKCAAQTHDHGWGERTSMRNAMCWSTVTRYRYACTARRGDSVSEWGLEVFDHREMTSVAAQAASCVVDLVSLKTSGLIVAPISVSRSRHRVPRFAWSRDSRGTC